MLLWLTQAPFQHKQDNAQVCNSKNCTLLHLLRQKSLLTSKQSCLTSRDWRWARPILGVELTVGLPCRCGLTEGVSVWIDEFYVITGLLLPVPLQLPLVSIMSLAVTDNYRSGMF